MWANLRPENETRNSNIGFSRKLKTAVIEKET
jgi:hypothetical protein